MKGSLMAVLIVLFLVGVLSADASAQTPAADPRDVVDRATKLAEPDFTLVNLPTTLRLPRMKSAFRVTHRFTRSLGNGDVGDLVGDLFGIDNGAQIGLEYRFGLFRGLQLGIHRTSDKTIQLFGQYDAIRQGSTSPVTMNVVASVEGANNFHRGDLVSEESNEYATTLGMVLSRTWGR